MAFQYLEQRDSNDNIVKQGVVSKSTPFCNSNNSGIYDIIAENLRVLKETMDTGLDTKISTAETSLNTIKSAVDVMYNDMRTNPNFGSTAATEQANIAIQKATEASTSATNAKTSEEKTKAYLDSITLDIIGPSPSEMDNAVFIVCAGPSSMGG